MAGGLLDKGSISLRERELVIDRTTARCGSEYEWGVHVAFFAEARRPHARRDCIDLLDAPNMDPLMSPREQLILRLVDALHETSTIDETLWTALKAEFSDEQLIELVVADGLLSHYLVRHECACDSARSPMRHASRRNDQSRRARSAS